MSQRRRDLIAFGLVILCSLGGFMRWSALAAADDFPIINNPLAPETYKEVPYEEAKKVPGRDAYKEDEWGRITQYPACYDFGPYPGVTQRAYNVTNIVLCGNVNVALPPPSGVEPPPGQTWQCFDGPDAIKYTVPFTLPTCSWGSGGSFLIDIDDQTLQQGLAASADLKVRRSADDRTIVPTFTDDELRAIRVRYARDQLRGQQLFEAQRQTEFEHEKVEIMSEFLKDSSCLVPVVGGICGAAELAYGKNLITDEPLKPEEVTADVLAAVTLGAAGIFSYLARNGAAKGAAAVQAANAQATARAYNEAAGERQALQEELAHQHLLERAARGSPFTGTTQAEIVQAAQSWARDAARSGNAINEIIDNANRSARALEANVRAQEVFREAVIAAAEAGGTAGDVTSSIVKLLIAKGVIPQ